MVENKQISAKVIADSVSPQGQRITTFELEYPRIIHSELMTHRLFSRNAMSSRAIPVKKMIEQVRQNPAMPVKFGKNQPGMQDGGEHTAQIKGRYTAEEWWALAGSSASHFAEGFADAGYHKQIANRVLEPFQRMKSVFTATDLNNFWWLRIDADADPTIEALVKEMKRVFDDSNPEALQHGEWHTPYVGHKRSKSLGLLYFIYDEHGEQEFVSKEDAIAISSSCCAQVSYRVLNSTKEKALDIYQKLISGNKVHASPFEHVATPMMFEKQIQHSLGADDPSEWEEGVTHVDRKGNFWSGNFRSWIQLRQLVPNNVIRG